MAGDIHNLAMANAYLDRRYAPRSPGRWTWIARYWDSNGRPLAASIGFWTSDPRDTWKPRAYGGRQLRRLNERDARARLRDFDDAMLAGTADRVAPTDWDLWVDEVIERNAGTIAPTTLVDYEHALRLFGRQTGCPTPRHVDRKAVKAFLQAVSAQPPETAAPTTSRGRSPATVNKYLAALCRIWNSEFPHVENPFKACKSERAGGVRRLKVAETEWHRVTPTELKRLLGELDARWKGMVLVAYTAGLRSAEIANLTWGDLDLDAMTISVAPKADTEATWHWKPKDHERRALPLTPETKLALLRLRRIDGCPYVFVEGERYKHLMEGRAAGRDSGREVFNNFVRTWKAACRRAGLPETEFHALRKTCITNWLESGCRGARVEPHEVRRLAGHSSIDTTMRYYTQVAKEALSRARKASASYADRASSAG